MQEFILDQSAGPHPTAFLKGEPTKDIFLKETADSVTFIEENPQETADSVTFIEEILNGKLHFL